MVQSFVSVVIPSLCAIFCYLRKEYLSKREREKKRNEFGEFILLSPQFNKEKIKPETHYKVILLGDF